MTVKVRKIKHLKKRKLYKKFSKRATLALPFLARVYNRWDMALTAKPVSSRVKIWQRQVKVLRFVFGKIKKQVRGLALLARLNLKHYLMRVRIVILKLVKSAKSFSFVRSVKALAGFVIRATATALIPLLILAPAFSAFEAHIINVTAEPAQIDPPVLTPPGAGIPWYDPFGGIGLSGTVEVEMTDEDPDATHIFYTYVTGTTTPSVVPDPVCGESLGGPKDAPQQVSFTGDTVVKAIACDGNATSSHRSVINTKIYIFEEVCSPTPVDFPHRLAVLAAGSLGGGDDVTLAANVVVNGDVRSNDDILAPGGTTNRFINGNATASGQIATDKIVISGTVTTSAPPTTLPLSTTTIQTWKDQAAAGGTINGSLIFPNNTTGIELGPTEIMGSLKFGSNNAVTVKGPLYIHGNLLIKSGSVITQDSSFADQFATIIVDGTVDIESNVSFVGAGSIGTFILISNASAKSGNNAAIETDSNPGQSDLGRVVLYASEGDVHINSHRTLLAVFAKHGDSSGNPAIDLESNVTVNWRPLPGEIVCGSVFTPLKRVLINEFLPNPSGEDNAPMPAGEWVELYNGLEVPVDVNGWVLYDSDDSHELKISLSNTSATSTVIQPGGLLVVYRNSDSDFELNNRDDEVRLYNAPIGLGGVEVDSHLYDYGGTIPDNKSFARIPDGSANWVDPEPTPGEPNGEFFVADVMSLEEVVYETVKEEEENQPEGTGEEELTQEEESVGDSDGGLEESSSVTSTDESLALVEGSQIKKPDQIGLADVIEQDQTVPREPSGDEQVTEQPTEPPTEDPLQTGDEIIEGTDPKEEEGLLPQDESASEVVQESPASDEPPADTKTTTPDMPTSEQSAELTNTSTL